MCRCCKINKKVNTVAICNICWKKLTIKQREQEIN